jgi:formylglycine-generating enzyme required for sulfatase activity
MRLPTTTAYDSEPGWTGINVPTNNVSWYEAAQFVNWLNITSNHTPAYKFTGTQGTGDYTFAVWDVIDAGYDASNPYRNSNAFYFLPTQDEWVKAAYWNGTTKQAYATIDNAAPVAGVDTNYDNPTGQPWDVGSGSEELNGTYDMMGNVMEWMESPYNSGEYLYNAIRPLRGGAYYLDDSVLKWSKWYGNDPDWESSSWGFRVASVIPEPCTLLLLGLGGLIVCRRERR